MPIDITGVDGTTIFEQGALVVHPGSTSFVYGNEYTNTGLLYSSISGKYDARFDDPNYYG